MAAQAWKDSEHGNFCQSKGNEHPLERCSLRETGQDSSKDLRHHPQHPSKDTGEGWGHQKGKQALGTNFWSKWGANDCFP